MSRHHLLFILVCAALVAGVILFVSADHVVELQPEKVVEKIVESMQKVVAPGSDDIGPQPQLANPPKIVKAIYATGYSAGSSNKVNYFMDLLNTTELNAIVVDIKDYTGMVSYEPNIEDVKKYSAWENKIPRINSLIKKFHDAGIYVIGRIAVFQDKALVKARPDLALHSSSTGEVWADYKKVNWLDTAAQPVWDYNIAIAKDALARGFDEINFDYIRFASDGNLNDIKYPYFDETTLKHNTVKKFFAYVREQLPQARISGDLFGLVTEDKGDMGIGQHLEDSLASFDVVAPMTYPSHYASGYRNFTNPAAHPYEVMKFAMDSALTRLQVFSDAQVNRARMAFASSSLAANGQQFDPAPYKARAVFRPWLQDFNLGATYTAAMVRAQIQAIYDAGCQSRLGAAEPDSSSLPNLGSAELTTSSSSEQIAPRLVPCSENIQGWMIWNPSNIYTKAALLPKEN